MRANIKRNQLRRVVIVGGGIGGLQLAMSLRKTGFQVVLIDKNTPVRDKKHHNKRGQKVGSLMEILYLCICKSINYKNNHYDYRLQSYRIVLYYR